MTPENGDAAKPDAAEAPKPAKRRRRAKVENGAAPVAKKRGKRGAEEPAETAERRRRSELAAAREQKASPRPRRAPRARSADEEDPWQKPRWTRRVARSAPKRRRRRFRSWPRACFGAEKAGQPARRHPGARALERLVQREVTADRARRPNAVARVLQRLHGQEVHADVPGGGGVQGAPARDRQDHQHPRSLLHDQTHHQGITSENTFDDQVESDPIIEDLEVGSTRCARSCTCSPTRRAAWSGRW